MLYPRMLDSAGYPLLSEGRYVLTDGTYRGPTFCGDCAAVTAARPDHHKYGMRFDPLHGASLRCHNCGDLNC